MREIGTHGVRPAGPPRRGFDSRLPLWGPMPHPSLRRLHDSEAVSDPGHCFGIVFSMGAPAEPCIFAGSLAIQARAAASRLRPGKSAASNLPAEVGLD